jgi:hypothetical protein
MEDIWNITDRNWSPQCKETIIAAIINLTNTIWSARNQVRFNNKRISLPTAISLIIANTCLSGNNTKKVASNSIRDFSILEFFKINIDNQNSLSVKEILWQPPIFNWVKCNIDGTSKGNPGFMQLILGIMQLISCFVLLNLFSLLPLIWLSYREL